MKKLAAIVLCTLLLFSTVAMAAAQPEPFDEYARPLVSEGGKLVIGYMHNTGGAESMIRSNRQAEIECAKRGWELRYVIFETDQEAVDGFNNLVQQGVDAIVLTGMQNMNAKTDMIIRARQEGIGVYCNDNQIVDAIISNCTQPNGQAAMQLAYAVGEDFNWEGNAFVLTMKSMNMHLERTDPIEALIGQGHAFPNMIVCASEDVPSGGGNLEKCYQYAQTWRQQYGDDMDCVFASYDGFAIAAAEAIIADGDPHGDNVVCAGIDGGSQAWAYIRNNTPFKYSLAQPFELYTHNVFEIIDAIQVRGLNPGDEGCLLKAPGTAVYATGLVITPDNCPAIGTNIHAVFDYYGKDKDDAEAWFNWDDGKGIYIVTDGD